MKLSSKVIVGVIALAVAIGGGVALWRAINRYIADQEAAAVARAGDRAVVASNKAWQSRMDLVQAGVDRAVGSKDSAVAVADSLRTERQAAPPLPKKATPSDSAAYYRQESTLAKKEAVTLRTALAADSVALWRLQGALDSARARVDTTSHHLEGANQREETAARRRFLLSLIPHVDLYAAGDYAPAAVPDQRYRLDGGVSLSLGDFQVEAGAATNRGAYFGGRLRFHLF